MLLPDLNAGPPCLFERLFVTTNQLDQVLTLTMLGLLGLIELVQAFMLDTSIKLEEVLPGMVRWSTLFLKLIFSLNIYSTPRIMSDSQRVDMYFARTRQLLEIITDESFSDRKSQARKFERSERTC